MTSLIYIGIALLLIFKFRGFLLFLIAWALLLPLTIINYIVVTIKSSPSGYFLSTALNLDIFANREFRALWNSTLKKPNGYKFGHFNETISGVLGKNKRENTLSCIGKALAFTLDTLDENHCINSIDDNISWNDRMDLGLVKEIPNINRKPMEANFYLKLWTNRFGVNIPLLLTEKEYAKISLRTAKNIEDWVND